MTKEDAVEILKQIEDWEGEDMPIYDTDVEAAEMGIDSLSRDIKLEKIREEIDQYGVYQIEDGSETFLKGICRGLQIAERIIDKHMKAGE